MHIYKLIVLSLVFLFSSVIADEVVLNPTHPEHYTVVRGDTLWDISERFLRDPWLWPEVWQVNPQIENPHLIYPGDVISLVYINGKPQLVVKRGPRTIKLSPSVRREMLDKPIPTIPLDAIRQFLTKSRVLTRQELEDAPYLVRHMDGRLTTGAGDDIYVRSIDKDDVKRFSLFRKGRDYRRPGNNELLGYEAIYIGQADLLSSGDPATLKLTSTSREALIGDRLFPTEQEEIRPYYQPHAPGKEVHGNVVSIFDGISMVGSHQVVALDLGEADGMEVGHVLSIHQRGKKIRDTVKGGSVTLPDVHSGTLMIFRIFEKMSYALVMNAERPIQALDLVSNP